MQYRTHYLRRFTTILLAFALTFGALFAMETVTADAATALRVTPSTKTIYVGGKVTLRANKKVKWSIVNKKTNIKLLNKTSKKVTVKGVKAGTVYVKAKAGSKYKKVKIVVRSKVPTTINLARSMDIVGVRKRCMVYVKSVSPSYASSSVKFSSSNSEIATVDSEGYVKGISPGVVTITATSKLNSARKASVTIIVADTLEGKVKTNIDCTDESIYPAGQVTRVWVPVPQNQDIQNAPSSTRRIIAPAAKEARFTTDSAGNDAAYIEWDETVEPADRTATVVFDFLRQATIRPDNLEAKESGSVDNSKFAGYLKSTSLTGSLTSGVVKDTADNIVQDAEATTVYQKAYAIYNWVCDNLYIDNNATYIGMTDAESILSNPSERYGYADINQVFVALCRAAGIPARCIYGLDMTSINGDVSGPQYQICKPQFYLPGYGWVDGDASAVLMACGGYEDRFRTKYLDQWNDLLDGNWGFTDAKWMALTSGEDITLSPSQTSEDAEDPIFNSAGELKYFAYPYAECNGQYIRSYNQSSDDKSELKYTYSFDQYTDDCGCD